MLNDTIWRRWSCLCCIWQLPRDTYNKRLRRGKQKCTNINIVDANTCTLDIAKLLKISFYPTREQEEQAILPKPIVTCPPSDGCWSEARRRWRWLADCSDCNEIIPNLQRKGLYCSDTDLLVLLIHDCGLPPFTTSYNMGDVAKVINCPLGSEETMGSYQRWGV